MKPIHKKLSYLYKTLSIKLKIRVEYERFSQAGFKKDNYSFQSNPILESEIVMIIKEIAHSMKGDLDEF